MSASDDRWEIQDLVADYCHAVDDRDLDRLLELFAADGAFVHADRSVNAVGRDEVREFYATRLARYGPTFHYPHSLVVTNLTTSSANGVVSAHAELAIDGELVVGAMRYDDRYVKEGGAWRFAERLVHKRYFMRFTDLASEYAAPYRTHYPEPRSESDLPEKLSTWQQFSAGERAPDQGA